MYVLAVTGNNYNMKKIKNYFRMLAGAFLMAVSYKCIFDSAGMVTGGFSGLSIIIKEVFGAPLWISMTALNIPVFIAAFMVKGKEFVKSTLVATFMLTAFLGVLPEFAIEENDLLLAAIFGGVIGGSGIGLVITSFATTGGTDMIAAIVQKYLPYYSIAQIMQVLDAFIVAAGAFVFGIYSSLYAIIAIYVMALVSDRVVDGMKTAKAVYIISDKYEQIAKKIIEELDRGGTFLEGRGIYSEKKKSVIMCVVSRKQAVVLKKIVWEEDRKAFIMISDVREAIGEGFVKNSQ